jgi:hypothetical protein
VCHTLNGTSSNRRRAGHAAGFIVGSMLTSCPRLRQADLLGRNNPMRLEARHRGATDLQELLDVCGIELDAVISTVNKVLPSYAVGRCGDG